MDVTRTLAKYVVEADSASIPAGVRREAIRSVLNWTGCAVGGAVHPSVDIALAAIRPFAGSAQAGVFGRSERTDILHAALLTGIASHVFDFDDTHLKTIIHPAGPVASALFSYAQQHQVSGRDLVDAFILGVEVECRIGNAVYPAHYDIGWHITGTAGVFGSAAAIGRLLKLDEKQMVWALGIAGTQSSGFREMFGTMCKSFHPGRAAQNGMLAAFLAQQNFTSSDRVLEAPRGFAHVMSAARNFDEITKGLGDSFEVALNTYKPFACGIVIHPSIDGCVQLRNEFGLKAGDIEAIGLRVAPLVLELTGKKTPRVGLEGKFSVYHSAAVAIIHGRAGEEEYSDACVADPQVIALRDRVAATPDKSLRDDECHVTVRLKDGRVLERYVPHAIGSLERPMSDADLDAKFDALVEPVLGRTGCAGLRQTCWALDGLADAAELPRKALRPAG